MTSNKGTIRAAYLTEEMATVCQICGRRFVLLGQHIKKHGHTSDSYKILYGLPLTVGLCSASHFEKMSAIRKGYIADNPDHLGMMRLKNPPGIPRTYKARGTLAKDLPIRASAYREQQRLAATKLWESRHVAIEAMWADGAALSNIAASYSVSEGCVRNWIRKWALPRRRMVFVLEPRKVIRP